MGLFATMGALCCLVLPMSNRGHRFDSTAGLYPDVQKFIQQRVGEFDQIPADRKAVLEKLAQYIATQKQTGKSARLIFICTHNSRRSHMAQIWAAIAAANYGFSGIECYSGGTEATAFNPRAIACLRRAGIKIEQAAGGNNPRYAVRFRENGEAITAFSKVYSDDPNPRQDYCAVMTCSQADKACPLVRGCSLRVAIPYDDPKAADDSPQEAKTYDERSAQISREMLFLFSVVRK